MAHVRNPTVPDVSGGGTAIHKLVSVATNHYDQGNSDYSQHPEVRRQGVKFVANTVGSEP